MLVGTQVFYDRTMITMYLLNYDVVPNLLLSIDNCVRKVNEWFKKKHYPVNIYNQ